MKRKTIATACFISVILVFNNCARQNDLSALKGPYLGQKPPGDRPEVFAPGIVSTGLDELNSVFSPDGTRILFSSRRPRPGSQEPRKDNDFWMAQRQGDSWGEAVYLGSGINSDSEDYYPMMTENGTIYFSSQREGPGTNNIYRSEFVSGQYAEAVKLGDAINTTEYREYDPYVYPDEDLLIFTSERPGGLGWGEKGPFSGQALDLRGIQGGTQPSFERGERYLLDRREDHRSVEAQMRNAPGQHSPQ